MWPNPQETSDLVTFTEETLNGKLHFLCSIFPRRKVPRMDKSMYGHFSERHIFPLMDNFLSWHYPNRQFSKYHLLKWTFSRRLFFRITYKKNKKGLIWTKYSEVSVSAIITDNTTKRNDTFSISITELLILLEMLKHL